MENDSDQAGALDDMEMSSVDTAREYRKFYGLIVVIAVVALAFSWGNLGLESWLRYFMGIAFLVFGFTKFLDYEESAESLKAYDIVAQRFGAYGYIYPFIELILGAVYLFNLWPLGRNLFALVFLGASAYGIWKTLQGPHGQVRCVCLGSVIKLPLTTISLYEDVVMVAMALTMTVLHFI